MNPPCTRMYTHRARREQKASALARAHLTEKPIGSCFRVISGKSRTLLDRRKYPVFPLKIRNELTLPVPGRSYSKGHVCCLNEHGRIQQNDFVSAMLVQSAGMALPLGPTRDWKREFISNLQVARAVLFGCVFVGRGASLCH